MLSNNGTDGNRKSLAADHLTPEPKESFACSVQKDDSAYHGQGRNVNPFIRYREQGMPDSDFVPGWEAAYAKIMSGHRR